MPDLSHAGEPERSNTIGGDVNMWRDADYELGWSEELNSPCLDECRLVQLALAVMRKRQVADQVPRRYQHGSLARYEQH